MPCIPSALREIRSVHGPNSRFNRTVSTYAERLRLDLYAANNNRSNAAFLELCCYERGSSGVSGSGSLACSCPSIKRSVAANAKPPGIGIPRGWTGDSWLSESCRGLRVRDYHRITRRPCPFFRHDDVGATRSILRCNGNFRHLLLKCMRACMQQSHVTISDG